MINHDCLMHAFGSLAILCPAQKYNTPTVGFEPLTSQSPVMPDTPSTTDPHHPPNRFFGFYNKYYQIAS